MITPEWFFSTLAQASATIVGFILAFSAILHQLDRRERNRRTEKLRDELIGLRDKYQRVFITLNDLFAEIEEENVLKKYIANQRADANELLEIFKEDDEIEYPHVALLWMLFRRVLLYLDRIKADTDPSKDYLLTLDQFDYLRVAINTLYQKLRDDEFTKALFRELNPGFDERLTRVLTTQVIGTFDDDRIQHRESAVMEDVYAQEIQEWLFEHTDGGLESVYNGRNIRSWSQIVGMLLNEFQQADSHKVNTRLDYDPIDIRNIILVSGALTLIGVFIPILFLINPLPTFLILTGGVLTLIQFLLTVGTVLLSGYLFLMIYQNLTSNWN